MSYQPAQLLRMSQEQLDALFRQSAPGPLPDGEGTGTAVVWPGTLCARFVAWFVRWFCWQGKVFHAAEHRLVNRISPFSFPAIHARVYVDKSWLDGQECIVLDYSQTSFVARFIRDEIREVSPGLYLGKVFVGRQRAIDFLISFQYQPERKLWRRLAAGVGLLVLLALAGLAVRLSRDVPVTYGPIEEHFKYGSTGGERASGIPESLWKLLPELFAARLPGPGLASLGFIYEKGRPLPVGTSQRNVMGIDRVFLNCAVCHAGTVRDTPDSQPQVILGMPANTLDLQAFQLFLTGCAMDENFTAARLVPELAQRGTEDGFNRFLLRVAGINLMRDRLLLLRERFHFMDREPAFGPGRVDTFNSPKVLLNFRMDHLPTNEWIGVCDFPSIWNQRQREGLWLHWDGNNNSVQERNRSAAFGTGATPPTLDRASIQRTEAWLLDAQPPAYRYPIHRELAARGEPLYQQYRAACHGRNGRDFAGPKVGQVTPIEDIQTDRHRLDSYSYELCVNQNLLYAGYGPERFSHFRKTRGYANAPLDGLWLRAPYLHNGSVPTLRHLLEYATNRPAVFYRGNDVFEPGRVGFVWEAPEGKDRKFFRYDTRLPGNGNQGHEGPAYGTDLSDEQKDALVEFLKTF